MRGQEESKKDRPETNKDSSESMRARSEGVQTVEKALTILTTFTHSHSLWGVTELSNKLGLPKSVIHRILISMQKFGFVEKDPLTEKYRLGLRVFELGKVAASQMGLRNISLPIMENLARTTGESIFLTKRDGNAGVGIECVEGPQSMTLKASDRGRLPLHCGASKKILLAYESQEFIEHYMQTENLVRLSDNSPINPKALRKELAKIRREGLCISTDEVDFGAAMIAAPIFDHNDKLAAGLGIGGPAFRFTPEKVKEFSRLVKNAAMDISHKLGYST